MPLPHRIPSPRRRLPSGPRHHARDLARPAISRAALANISLLLIVALAVSGPGTAAAARQIAHPASGALAAGTDHDPRAAADPTPRRGQRSHASPQDPSRPHPPAIGPGRLDPLHGRALAVPADPVHRCAAAPGTDAPSLAQSPRPAASPAQVAHADTGVRALAPARAAARFAAAPPPRRH